MSTPTSKTPAYYADQSGEYYIDSLLFGTKWSTNSLTFSFINAFSSYYVSDYNQDGNTLDIEEPDSTYLLSDSVKLAIYSVLQEIQNLTGLTFTEVIDSSTVAGDLRFGGTNVSGTAWAYLPIGNYNSGDIWFSSAYDWSNQSPGLYWNQSLIHEIGHALGLKHPHETGIDNPYITGTIDFPIKSIDRDNIYYTTMSYKDFYGDDNESGAELYYRPTTLMMDDIAALQFLYGKNNSHNSGDTIYQWNEGVLLFETIWDGSGVDTISWEGKQTIANINLNPGTLSFFGANIDTSTNPNSFNNNEGVCGIAYECIVENAIGGIADDQLIGNSAANTLDGGSGADTLVGGDGNDTYIVDDASDVVTESNASDTQIDEVQSSVSWLLGDNLEKLTLTGIAAIDGNGNALGNTLTGNSAANTLDGGSGADTLVGGDGNDTYIVDLYKKTSTTLALQDAVTEGTSAGTDTLKLRLSFDQKLAAQTFTLAANLENLDASLTSTNKINLTGNSAANTLTGNAGDNVIDGGSGTDSLKGGTGNDTYIVDLYKKTSTTLALQDTVTEGTSAGTDTLKLRLSSDQKLAAQTFTLAANLENLDASLTSTNKINLTGNSAANTLTGNAAGNTLKGEAGSDTLYGGLGSDSLYGGVDKVRDVFDFNSIAESKVGTARDKVYNFLKGTDDIDLKTIDANTKVSGDQAFKSLYTKATANALWYSAKDLDGSTSTKDIIVYGDVNGDAKADFEIGLVGVASVTAADFVL